MALLMLDLDDFKGINDRHGHLFGDLVLRRMGRVLRRAVREADVACRYGGEEFAVVLPETDRLGAYALAERMRRRIAQKFAEPLGGQIAEVRISGGISAYPEDGVDAAALISRADEALYLAKSRGKDRISVHHSERRRDVRYPARRSASIQLARPGDPAPSGVVALNLSRGGALLVCADSILSGTPVSLRFDGRDPRGRRRSWLHAGRVLRVESGGWPAEGRRVAVAFDEPLPEECLFQLVRRTKIVRLAQGARS
jgi:diguanylate cyclase (GGDEF)-like protein